MRLPVILVEAGLIAGALSLGACRGSGTPTRGDAPTVRPATLNHSPTPAGEPAALPFLCSVPGWEKCGRDPRLAKFDCDEIAPAPFEGLTPAVPIAKCICPCRHNHCADCWHVTGAFVAYGGWSYLALLPKGAIRLLNSEEAFRAQFQPIDDAREALAYILEVTQTLRGRPDVLSGAHVAPAGAVGGPEGGWRVRVFTDVPSDVPRPACHKSFLDEITFLLRRDGTYEQEKGKRRRVWEGETMLCSD